MEIFFLIIAIFVIFNLFTNASEEKQKKEELENEYNEKFVKCNQVLLERKGKIDKLNETITNQNFQINKLYESVEKKEIELNNLKSKINELKINTNKFKAKIKKAETQYFELNEIRKKETQLLKELNENYLQLSKELEEELVKYNEIKKQNIQLAKNINEQEKIILKKDKNILKQELLLKKKNDEIIQLNEKNEKLTENIQDIKDDAKKENNRYSNSLDAYKTNEIRLENKIRQLMSSIEEKDEFYDKITNINDSNINEITSLLSDFLLLEYKISEQILLSNKRPAFKEVKRINELKKETKKYISQYKIMKYKYEFLLRLFPELEEFVDSFETIQNITKLKNLNTYYENYDNVRKYVTKEEYLKLSEIERNQLALDNYINSRKKSKWQIGRDYELMCGIDYLKDGWNVEFYGIEKKFKDMGRDLIARKENETHIVQCKLWSKNKVIHENHIAQLFGTTNTFEYNKLRLSKVIPVFITNTELSKTAQRFATLLEVKVIKKEMKEFPRIKCNVTKDTNGKEVRIYHLPFDQQYDRTHIKNEGEFYAYTVKEAVEKGFRRALKFNFNNKKQ